MSYLNEYLHAVENEICNDVRAYHLISEKPEDFNYLPRPGKWLSTGAKKNKNVICFIGSVLRFVWILGGAVCFFSTEFIIHLRHFLKASNEHDRILKFDEFALGFSARALDIINTSSIGRTPKCWIVLPWVGIRACSEQNIFSIYSILILSDFFKAWFLSVHSVYFLSQLPTTSSSVLQGYTAYRWFLTRLGLAHLKQGKFLTSEHFDRWTILIDAVARDIRVQKKMESMVSIVQHGVLGSLISSTDQAEVLPFEIKNKLTEVRHLYVYDEVSAKIFQQSVLDPICSVQVHFFKPQIILNQIPKKSGQLRILFVGHPICEDLHIFIFTELSKSLDMRAFYKPHPTSAPRRDVGELSWELITDRTCFPEVDVLISYPSTLVTEYSNKNIPAVQHPINLTPESAQSFMSQLRTEISKISL